MSRSQINETDRDQGIKEELTKGTIETQGSLNSTHFLTKNTPEGKLVRSSDFTATRTASPILIDNLSFTYRVVAGTEYSSSKLGGKKFYGPVEYAPFFADPFVYPSKKTRPLLKLFGRHNARTINRSMT